LSTTPIQAILLGEQGENGKRNADRHPADDAVTVRLRFTPQAGYELLKSRCLPRVDPLILRDAHVEVELLLGKDDLAAADELLTWILSWGTAVEVIGPASLRQAWCLMLPPDAFGSALE